MRYDAERKERTRERILEAAAKAIRSHGPHRVGVAAIMRRAGLTHGGFYAHFSSKDRMVAAGIERMFAQALSRWRVETENRPPAAGLRAYIDFYLSPAHRDARAAGCPIAALAPDLPRLSRRCRLAFATGVRDLTDRLARSLEQSGHDDAPTVASSTLAELVGALAIARAEPDRQRSDAILAASRRLLRRRLSLD